MSGSEKTTGLTKGEIAWLLERIAEGDTDWLLRAMSEHMRKKIEDEARSNGKSLLHLYLDNGGEEEEGTTAAKPEHSDEKLLKMGIDPKTGIPWC
tara:strand:+ start:423 stop:707 length:285 start_codon:yes stop_codon:yes gene_type:complete